MPHFDPQCVFALKTVSVERLLRTVCSCSNITYALILVQLMGYSFSIFPQLPMSVYLSTPKTLSQLTFLNLCISSFSLFNSPSRPPPASLSLRLNSHEVCIPHLLCRLQTAFVCRPYTKEQKALFLTCHKHSSPLGPFTQPESLIHPVASTRVYFSFTATA